jgi:hypothetical protein
MGFAETRWDVGALDAMEGVHAVCNVAENLLTADSGFSGRKGVDLADHDAPIALETGVVRARPTGLNPQGETAERGVLELERFGLRFGGFARQEGCSDEGMHGEFSSRGA